MKWVEFVKDYAKKNNIKYGEALKKAKDAWKKHKQENPESHKPKKKAKGKSKAKPKSKPKSKPKKKSLKSNIKMEISPIALKEEARGKAVKFQLEKDVKVQEKLDEREAKEKLLDAQQAKKSYTDFLLEERAKGASAGEAPTIARRKVAEQELKIEGLKRQAKIGTPIGGALKTEDADPDEKDEKMLSGVRKTKLKRYKMLKAKVEKGMRDGSVLNRDYNTLVILAKELAGKSKTNQYAKLVKKLEKQIKTKGYQKASRRQMKQAQKQQLLLGKLERAAIQDKKRSERRATDRVFENRYKQLIRLGATEDEAKKIAQEEKRVYQEQQDLQKTLQIEKFRKTGKANIATGGLSYAQFVEKTAKDKNLSYAQATQQIKNQNLYQKYQIQAVQTSLPRVGTGQVLPSPPTAVPAVIAGRSKYLTKTGKVNANYARGVDTLIKRYNKRYDSPTSLNRTIGKPTKTFQKDLAKIKEYADNIPTLPTAQLSRLQELVGTFEPWVAGGFDNYQASLRALKSATAPLTPPPQAPPLGAPPKRKLPVKPGRSTSLSKAKGTAQAGQAPPTPAGAPAPKGKVPDDYKTKALSILNDADFDNQDKYDALQEYITQQVKDHSGISEDDFSAGKSYLVAIRKDVDEDLSGAGFGGSFSEYEEEDIAHDGDDEIQGGAITDNVRELGKKFSSALSRKAQQFQEPINLVIRGVGKIKGRKVVKQNAIDGADKHLLEMTIDSYATPEERQNIDGFQYNANVSNAEHAVYVNEALKKVVVAYRGSRTQEDWLESDKFIAKGKLEDSPRFKRESEYTKGLVDVVPDDYSITFTGSSLGGTLAYTLGHAHKQRAVVFNPGVGIDQAKKHGNDNTKFYHAEGDPISVMGVGAFRDNRMIRNSAGNFATAHSTSVFKTPSESGFSKGEHPDDHGELEKSSQTPAQQAISKGKDVLTTADEIDSVRAQMEASKEAIDSAKRRPIANVATNQPAVSDAPTNPAHYGDLGDFSEFGQQDPRNWTQRDIDTYTQLASGKGVGFDRIARNKIEGLRKQLNQFNNDYNKTNPIGGAFTIDKYADFKAKHEADIDSIEKGLGQLKNYERRVSSKMKPVVNQASQTLLHIHNNHKKYLTPKIANQLDKHLCNRLNHDRRRLGDLHIHGDNTSRGGSFSMVNQNHYDRTLRHKHKEQEEKLNPPNKGKDHARMSKIIEKFGKNLVSKIKGGNLTNRDHKRIKDISGKHLNKLKLDPHFSHFM